MAFSLTMYVKFASNELTLRADGTVTVVVFVLLLPPQADTIRPATAIAGSNRANFMRIPHRSKFPPPSSRACSGRECADGTTHSDGRDARLSITHDPGFVKYSAVHRRFCVRALDKPPQ